VEENPVSSPKDGTQMMALQLRQLVDAANPCHVGL